MARSIGREDNYRDKLIKLIPAEIVAAYLALQPHLLIIIEKDWGLALVRIVIAMLTIMTYFYLKIFGGVVGQKQLVFSTATFLVWVYSIAPEKILGGIWAPEVAGIVLVLWTLMIPFFFPPDKPVR